MTQLTLPLAPPPTIRRPKSKPLPPGPLTVAAARRQVATWTDLTAQRRRELASALSSTARLVGKQAEPEAVLLTPAALRQTLFSRSASGYGLSDSRMRNILSGLRVVLRRLDVIDPVDLPVAPDWDALLARLDTRPRAGMIGFARFCSQRGITPAMVDEATLAAFEARLTARTLTPRPRKFVGEVRGRWNRACTRVEGWPGRRLAHRRDPHDYILPPGAFPQGFRDDLEAFGRYLAGTVLDDPYNDEAEALQDDSAAAPAHRTRPLRPITVELRQSHCRWAASALVATGVPVTEITSLHGLVTPPERAKTILRFLYQRAGNKPSAAGGHVAEVLRIVAKYHARLPPQDVARIRQWGGPVRLTYHGMTEKNETRIRAVLEPAREAKLLELPAALMEVARKLLAASPQQASSLALRAVAIEMLTRAPLRLANLIGLKDHHLQRSDPPRGRISRISIPPEETKNKRAIGQPVADGVADLLEEWITRFRPLVAAPGCPYLFPGQGTGSRSITPQGMRDAVKDVTRKYVGVVLSPHQFRHLTARMFLRAFQGQYEPVRQFLGHASITTTVRHYSGIESEASAQRFDEVILARRRSLKRMPPTGPHKDQTMEGH